MTREQRARCIQLEASIATGNRNARFYRYSGCPVSAARIEVKVAAWEYELAHLRGRA